jgi:hypothetical protein
MRSCQYVGTRKDTKRTHQNLRGLPHTVVHGPHSPAWQSRAQRWPPQPSSFPQGVPHDTFSCAQRTFPTSFFPHAHRFVVRKGHGGHGAGSSWHACGTRECPHSSGGRSQGCRHWIRVPHGTGGIKTVRAQRQMSCMLCQPSGARFAKPHVPPRRSSADTGGTIHDGRAPRTGGSRTRASSRRRGRTRAGRCRRPPPARMQRRDLHAASSSSRRPRAQRADSISGCTGAARTRAAPDTAGRTGARRLRRRGHAGPRTAPSASRPRSGTGAR